MPSIFVTTKILAYFADADKAENQIVIGGSNIQISEEFEVPKEVKPGVSFKKDVKITNLGPSDCYIRVKAVFSNSDIGKYCEVDWNESDWIYHETDGYYYYKNPMGKGEWSTSLFTTITILETTPEVAIKDFEIIIYAESYQAGSYDSYIEAWEQYRANKPN